MHAFVLFATGVCSLAAITPPERPVATLEFSASPTEWVTTLEMTTASGAKYLQPLKFDAIKQGNVFRFDALRQLIDANWMAELEGERSVMIYGARKKDRSCDPVKTLIISHRVIRGGRGDPPKLSGTGGAAVEIRKDATAPPASTKPPPPGPDLGDEAYVEFDFSTLPRAGDGEYRFRVIVLTPHEKVKYDLEVKGPRKFSPETHCDALAYNLRGTQFKAQVVGETKLRVYGCVNNGYWYPATEGRIESAELTKDELPKVTNPQKKG